MTIMCHLDQIIPIICRNIFSDVYEPCASKKITCIYPPSSRICLEWPATMTLVRKQPSAKSERLSRGIGVSNWIFSTPWFAWRGRRLTMEKYRRPRPASKTGNLGFPRLDRALRIFAYREMFNFRWQKVAGYL